MMTDALPVMQQDFDADFDAIVAGLRIGYDGPPYALVRFGDGEAAIMNGREHVAKSDGWIWPANSVLAADAANRTSYGYDETKLPTKLFLSLTEDKYPDYYVGITAEEHHPQAFDELTEWVFDERTEIPDSRITYAEIFMFANYDRWLRMLFGLRHCCIVASSGPSSYMLPRDAITTGWDCRLLVDRLIQDVRRPILVSGGPVAKVLIHDYWTRCPPASRQVILDVGSALDERLRLRLTRTYHHRDSPQRTWKPLWKLTDLSARAYGR